MALFSSLIWMMLLGSMVVEVRKSTRGGSSRRGSRGGRGRGVGAGRGQGGRTESGQRSTIDTDGEDNNGERLNSDARDDGEHQEENREKSNDVVTFERADRGISKGHYPNKPKPGQPKYGIVNFSGGTSIVESVCKKTAKSLLRAHWSGLTVNKKGEARDGFLDGVIDEFREYYDYPEGYTQDQGNSIVKIHLGNNVRQNMFKEREKADKKVTEAIARGQTDLTKRDFQPHYLTEDTWKAMNDYWESPLFKRYSQNGKDNRGCKKLAHSTGAKPFAVLRDELEAIEGQPVTDLKLFEVAYQKKGQPIGTLTNPAAVEMKEKFEKVYEKSLNTNSGETSAAPESPTEQKRKTIQLTLEAQGGPKRGRVLMHPRHNVTELLGPDLAATWSSQKTLVHKAKLPGTLIKRGFNAVMDLGESLRCIDSISRTFLNEELQRLANEAVPNKDSAQGLWDDYIYQMGFILDGFLERHNMIIDEDAICEKTPRLESDEDDYL